MTVKLTDAEIDRLVAEPKQVDSGWGQALLAKMRDKRGHREGQVDLTGMDGNAFRVMLRQSSLNPLDFSVILAFCPKESNRVFKLRRYNGKSHEHTNAIERDTMYGFHIHEATERYQSEFDREEGFATATERYSTVETALVCLMADCGFTTPLLPDLPLFQKRGPL